MSRTARPNSVKGSEYWLRLLVNKHAPLFNQRLATEFSDTTLLNTNWLSPLKTDGYAEYRDQAFLNRLSIILDKRGLSQFWPYGGPRWDALGRTPDGSVVLVEAKAHIGELRSLPTKATGESLQRVTASLNEAKKHIGSASAHDWSSTYYQYTNRLAHLYLLREVNGVKAYLAFVYFVDAPDMKKASVTEWKEALLKLHQTLGLGQHGLSPYIGECFIDAKLLQVVKTLDGAWTPPSANVYVRRGNR